MHFRHFWAYVFPYCSPRLFLLCPLVTIHTAPTLAHSPFTISSLPSLLTQPQQVQLLSLFLSPLSKPSTHTHTHYHPTHPLPASPLTPHAAWSTHKSTRTSSPWFHSLLETGSSPSVHSSGFLLSHGHLRQSGLHLDLGYNSWVSNSGL
jgi:hypothetical protein